MEYLIKDIGYNGDSVLASAMALVAGLSLAVGVWVVVRERARRVSLSFLATTIAVAVYLFGFSYVVRSPSSDVAVLWVTVAYLGVPFIVPGIYHFSMELLGLSRKRSGWITAAWIVGVAQAALAIGTDLLIAGVVRKPWGYYNEMTVWQVPFIAWSIVVVGLAMGDYWRMYRDAEPVQRARIRWLATPLVIGSFAFIDYVPTFGIDMLPLGFVALAALPLAAAWVVTRYHLPDLTPAFAADQILVTMAEPLLVVNDLGRVAISNAAVCRLLGRPEEELEGRMLSSLLGAETAETLLSDAGLKGHEMELEGRSGAPVAVSVTTNPLVVKGRTMGTVIVARDIRERLRAARELERREQYFRALIEKARDTITVLDAEGRVRYQSPSHAEVLGRKAGEAVGESAFEWVHPDDVAGMQKRFADLVADPGGTARAEVRMRHSDGGYRMLDLRAQNLLDHPAVRGIVVNGRDITEERRLMEQLQQAEKLEAIGRLAGGIAHDFNNILTTIQGTVVLMEEADDGSDLSSDLATVREGAERAGRLTSQLLAFGRRQVTQPEKVDLNRVIDELRSVLQHTVGEDHHLVIEKEPGLGPVRVDRAQLEKALVDLAANAGDAMDSGDRGLFSLGTANVALDGDRAEEMELEPGPYVVMRVADTGCGMDEQTRQRVFEPFFTTKENDLDAGLGLATVYGVVRQADGHIEVESRPGHGTRFSIYLPRVEPETVASARRDASDDAEPGDQVVLVVEDEAPVRALVTKVLKREGYRVLDAESGEAALEVARANAGRIDLLVADLAMPGISGREVAEKLSADDPGMEVILISGYTADEVVRDGIERGEYEFIPKPFSPATLTERVADVLRGRRTTPT